MLCDFFLKKIVATLRLAHETAVKAYALAVSAQGYAWEKAKASPTDGTLQRKAEVAEYKAEVAKHEAEVAECKAEVTKGTSGSQKKLAEAEARRKTAQKRLDGMRKKLRFLM
jgi:hypothetical protein